MTPLSGEQFIRRTWDSSLASSTKSLYSRDTGLPDADPLSYVTAALSECREAAADTSSCSVPAAILMSAPRTNCSPVDADYGNKKKWTKDILIHMLFSSCEWSFVYTQSDHVCRVKMTHYVKMTSRQGLQLPLNSYRAEFQTLLCYIYSTQQYRTKDAAIRVIYIYQLVETLMFFKPVYECGKKKDTF